MITVNSNNIVDIIKFLYDKRLNQSASEEIIDSWKNLSDSEAQQYLNELFKTWGYSDEDIENELLAFEKETNKLNVIEATTSTNVTDQYNYNTNYTSNNSNYQQQTINAPSQSSFKSWLWLIIIPILAGSAFVLYKYKSFKSMHYLYVTTDNVSIRDYQGNNIGRMDIFKNTNSVSYLRTTDKNTYPITVNNKIYACRKVVFDSTSFFDYLMNKAEAFGYVNENYVIDDEVNFQLYRNIFKVINGVKIENSSLTSAFRNVIIGSIKQNPNLSQLYINSTCNNSDKNYSSIIKHKAKNNILQVVAQLSDGKYYIFSGNPETNQFEAPKAFEYNYPDGSNMGQFSNENILFKFVNQTYFIFGCDLSARDYYVQFDENNKITFAKYSYQ